MEKEPLSRRSDEALVEECKNNNHDAFAALVGRYKHRVHWLAKRMLGSDLEEDIAQEVFIRVYQALPGFRGEAKFSTWLYKITRNLCLVELRRRGRRGEHISWEEEGEESIQWLLPDGDDSLEQQIERQDISRRVRALIGRLPEEYRTALTLFYLSQVSYEEIADIMEIPLGTVKTYLHRGRLRLRKLLTEESGLVIALEGPGADVTRHCPGEHRSLGGGKLPPGGVTGEGDS
ncbi:MAG: sigma-70 family RNA polymerase sigma factor [Candidatus Eiseniibacteriota bacterium]|nr:MAG: sigma-70 family RNA polymerase sigma factor [Candidatus Eisenbacteria bacterium]